MKLRKLYEGIKDGTVTFVTNGHDIRHFPIWELERQVNFNEEMLEKHKDDDMTVFYERSNEVEFNNHINGLATVSKCDCCGDSIWFIPLDENRLMYISFEKDWQRINESTGKTFNPHVTEDIVYECSAKDLMQAQKLVARIEVPTGELVFRNKFNKDKFYEYKEKGQYNEKYNVGSISTRNNLMQKLAEQNIGYGQMTNTSVSIYSNGSDEILIGSDLERLEDMEWEMSDEYRAKFPYEDDDEYFIELKDRHKSMLEFKDILEKGDFKMLGEVSCDVWRWQCADKQILKAGREPINSKWDKAVIAKVEAGTWEIEHYFDFKDEMAGEGLYSRLKLVK